MYQKSSGLTKFILLISDLVCIVLSLFLTANGWHLIFRDETVPNYTLLYFLFIGFYIVIFFFGKSYGDFYIRGYLVEAWAIIKSNAIIDVATIIVLFAGKMVYSRMVVGLFAVVDCIIMWIAHIILKKILPYLYNAVVSKKRTILVGNEEFVSDIYAEQDATKDFSTEFIGIYFTNSASKYEGDLEVINSLAELKEFCLRKSVDSIIIDHDSSKDMDFKSIMDELGNAGIIIKYRQKIPTLDSVECQAVNIAGEHLVLTYATRSVSTGKVLLKRGFDIFAGLVGSLVAVILIIIFGPMIKIESKGPILFAQKRVGKNGRIFTIYKMRSMYLDAEKRKAELMAQNEMDGLMFKMDNDPRITKVGKFIRKTSIDEFPQFFNVLKGDMSMVGTRPPTLDEFEKYNLNQKGRLSFKPGITGMWQVSGRNSIKDFEDIVALDKKYIREWSPLLDIKIILKTIPAMFSGK